MEEVDIPITLADDSVIPTYGSEEAAGADLRAYLESPVTIEPGMTALISSGVACAIPQGYEIQVRPRSGLALKNQITVLNSPGTIDSDYRGEIKVILINHSKEPFVVTPGMRIAQIVLAPVVRARFLKQEQLVSTLRGEGGFGHTGTH